MIWFPWILFQVVTVAVGLARLPTPVDIAEVDPAVSVNSTTTTTSLSGNHKNETELNFRKLIVDEKTDSDFGVDIEDGETITLQRPNPADIEEDQGTNGSATATDLNQKTELESAKESSNKETSNTPVDTNGVRQVTDLTEDLLEWETPIWYQKYCPYYHAGYDEDGRPVWVAEFGKYPVKELGELNDDAYNDFDKSVKQASLRIINSIKAQNTSENEVNEAIYIIDMDGLDIFQLGSSKTIVFLLRTFTAYKDLIANYLGACIAINVNYITELTINVVRPVLGKAFEKVEIYGTNPDKWKAVLRRRLPKNTLPSWYGGSENFRPIQVYG